LGLSARFSHLATNGSDVPCTINETKVQKNTMLNISLALGKSATSGNMAKIIGTAPRNPTQDIYTLSLVGIFGKGNKHKKTVIGREKNIIKKLIIKPGIIIGTNSAGFTSKPKVRNIINCDIHAKPSKKLSDERL